MTFLSYELPQGAPQKLVWFVECDVCMSKHLGPFPNAPKVDQRSTVEGAGWRYQRPHPMDTCPACLALETEPKPVIKPATKRKPRKDARVIVWNEKTGNGRAPDGTLYGINSEQIRGEPRQYWAEFEGRQLRHPTDEWATSKDKAIQAAEHHYRKTHNPDPETPSA